MTEDITISESTWLNKAQYELDFVNVYLNKDIPLFIDPWAIRQWNDELSVKCHSLISDFFEHLLFLVKNDDKEWAITILDWLHEPKETNLWLSSTWKWLAIWKWHSLEIYEKLSQSKAAEYNMNY